MSKAASPEIYLALLIAIVCMAPSASSAASPGTDEKTYGKICDGYALNRYDLDAPAGATGVRFENVPWSEEAMEACRKAIAAAPQERRYLTQLARVEFRAGDLSEAFAHYREAADAGSAMAMHALGFMMENGCGTPEDHRAAMEQYKSAAALGQTSAMINLAFAKRIGWDVPYEPYAQHEARELLEQAASAGNADAMALMGDFYLHGTYFDGVLMKVPALGMTEPDLQKALEWYRRAYDGGSERSYWPLFLFYFHGVGEIPGGSDMESKAAEVAYTAIGENSLSFIRYMMANRESLPRGVVKAIQSSLAEQGYLHGPVDGIYGSGTQAALERLENTIERKVGDYDDGCSYVGG